MRENDKKKWIAIISLLAVNLITTAVILSYIFIPGGGEREGILNYEYVANGQYVLYIGINDKDTYDQIIPTDEAVEVVNGICAKYVEGYTMSHAKGGWVDDNGILTQENTLVYYIDYADESDVIAIMDEALSALNQYSILVERRNLSSAFYYGKESEK